MKLTDGIYIGNDGEHSYYFEFLDDEVKQQILKNQRDAEHWRELIAEYTDVDTGELKKGVLQQILDNKEKLEGKQP